MRDAPAARTPGDSRASVALQALGAAATLLTGIVIALGAGPEAQGRYGLMRSAADMLLALAIFGLPQGMVYALNQRGAQPRALHAWTTRYLVVCAGVLLALGAVAAFGWRTGLPFEPLAMVAIAIGAIGWLQVGLARTYVLCLGSRVRFAALTAAPALALLVAVLAMLAAGSAHYEWAVAASGVLAAGVGWQSMQALQRAPGWSSGAPVDTGELVRAGLHAFTQSAAVAFQPWLTFWMMQHAGVGVAAIGHAVFAAYVAQAFALPAAWFAPLLLVDASRGADGARHARRAAWRLVALSAAAAVVAVLVLPWLVPRLFGAGYAPAVAACQWIAASGPFLVANRLGVAILLGRGRFRVSTGLGLARVLALPVGLWIALDAASGAAAMPVSTCVAIAWCAVEVGCAALLFLALWARGPRIPA